MLNACEWHKTNLDALARVRLGHAAAHFSAIRRLTEGHQSTLELLHLDVHLELVAGGLPRQFSGLAWCLECQDSEVQDQSRVIGGVLGRARHALAVQIRVTGKIDHSARLPALDGLIVATHETQITTHKFQIDIPAATFDIDTHNLHARANNMGGEAVHLLGARERFHGSAFAVETGRWQLNPLITVATASVRGEAHLEADTALSILAHILSFDGRFTRRAFIAMYFLLLVYKIPHRAHQATIHALLHHKITIRALLAANGAIPIQNANIMALYIFTEGIFSRSAKLALGTLGAVLPFVDIPALGACGASQVRLTIIITILGALVALGSTSLGHLLVAGRALDALAHLREALFGPRRAQAA